MERLGDRARELARTSPHKDDIPLHRRVASGLGKPVYVTLVRWVQPEAIGQADGLFVERLELQVGKMLKLCRAVQQLAVKQFPTEFLREPNGDFTTPSAVLAGDCDQLHERATESSNVSHTKKRRSLRRVGDRKKLPPESNDSVGVISRDREAGRGGLRANPIA
jgi:hypothetical protein